MADVFISYATEDRPRVRELAESLGTLGLSVWWDREIPLGRAFDEVIEQALHHARCVVVLWSAASVASEWVRAEASEARRRRILIPVFLEHVEPPLAFRSLHGADLSGWRSGVHDAEFEKLAKHVRLILGQPAEGAPAPRSQGPPAGGHARGSGASSDGHRTSWRRRAAAGAAGTVALAAVAVALYPDHRSTSDGPGAPSTEASVRRPISGSPQLPAVTPGVPAPADPFSALPGGILGALGNIAGLGGTIAVPAFQLPDLGLHIAYLDREQSARHGLAASGAVVVQVESQGLAGKAGLRVLDVVVAVESRRIDGEDDLRQALKEIGPGKTRFVIRRAGEEITREIDCPACTLG